MRQPEVLAVFGEPRRVVAVILRGAMLRMSHLRMTATLFIWISHGWFSRTAANCFNL